MLPETVKRIVEESGADTVIHTAAISDIGTCQANPDASYEANVLLPVFLAKACKDRKLDILPDSVMLRAEWMFDYYQFRDNYFTNMVNAVDKVTASSVRFRGLTYVKDTKGFLEALGKNVEIEDTKPRSSIALILWESYARMIPCVKTGLTRSGFFVQIIHDRNGAVDINAGN